MNYNILCDKYATRHLYGYCPSWALAWDYRRKHILDELRLYSADIIALQVRPDMAKIRHRLVSSRKWKPISSIRSSCLNYASTATTASSVPSLARRRCANKIVATSMVAPYSTGNRSRTPSLRPLHNSLHPLALQIPSGQRAARRIQSIGHLNCQRCRLPRYDESCDDQGQHRSGRSARNQGGDLLAYIFER